MGRIKMKPLRNNWNISVFNSFCTNLVWKLTYSFTAVTSWWGNAESIIKYLLFNLTYITNFKIFLSFSFLKIWQTKENRMTTSFISLVHKIQYIVSNLNTLHHSKCVDKSMFNVNLHSPLLCVHQNKTY